MTQRWLRLQGPRQAGAVSSFSMLALIVEYLGGSPFAQYGISPQRIGSSWRSPPISRTTRRTGTRWVGATL
jgi:hypothetical protein